MTVFRLNVLITLNTTLRFFISCQICGLSHTWSSRRLYLFTLNFNLTAASIENILQKVGGIAALLQLCKIHQRLIYRVNVLICSGCYLLYIASSDVLKDKFHTKVDKLTRFFLCCCFTHGHGSLIPTRGAGELAVCLSLPAHFMFLSLRCDTLSSQNLFFSSFFCVCTHIPHRLEKWLQTSVVRLVLIVENGNCIWLRLIWGRVVGVTKRNLTRSTIYFLFHKLSPQPVGHVFSHVSILPIKIIDTSSLA